MPIALMVLGGLLLIGGGALLLYLSDNSAPGFGPIWNEEEPDTMLGVACRYMVLGGFILAGIGYAIL